MIATEHEAAQKACPFACSFNASQGRRTMHAGTSRNEFDQATCIGSSCMAWDFLDLEYINPSTYVIADNATARDRLNTVQRAGEDLEEYTKRITAAYTADGFERVLRYDAGSAAGWRKPHPARRGQCQRTLTVNQE